MVNLIGGVLALVGLVVTIFAQRLARLNEQLDAIGSKRQVSDVEPARWNVVIVRIIGVGIVLYGLWVAIV